IPGTAASPVLQALQANFEEISHIQHSVMEILQQRNSANNNGANGNGPTAPPVPMPAAAAPVKAPPIASPLHVSLDTHPYLLDHSLIRQRPGWHCPDDMEPVIPMTMILELFGDTALENAPGMQV